MIDHAQNRKTLLSKMSEGSVAIFSASPHKVRNHDNEYPYRQESSFYWLSGLTEPDAIIILEKTADKLVEHLVLQEKDPSKEIWTGKLMGVEGAVTHLKFDIAKKYSERDEYIPSLLLGKDKIYFSLEDTELMGQVAQWCKQAKLKGMQARREAFVAGKLLSAPRKLEDVTPLIHQLRLIKSPNEIELIQQACDISARAHLQLMRRSREGKTEGYLQGIFDGYCRSKGAQSLAYPTIVGSGDNGCCLHYEDNTATLKAKDLVLVDAGCEFQYYASDITRTFPVNGKFTREQRQLYEIVLEAQLAGIAACIPGSTHYAVEKAASMVMIDGLLRLGLLKGEPNDIFESGGLKQFYPHSIGHWVGLDVHDPMSISGLDGWLKYEPNMVLTVEPGIYIQPDNAAVDKKWRGIGIRIEDVVRITEEGCDVLSKGVIKDPQAIERFMGEANQARALKKQGASSVFLAHSKLAHSRAIDTKSVEELSQGERYAFRNSQ